MARTTTKSSSVKNLILFLPLIALIALIWLILLKIDQIPENLTMNLSFESWVNLWLVVLILIFLILVCIPQVGGKPAKEVYEPKRERRLTKRAMDSIDDIDSEKTLKDKAESEKPVEFVPLSKTETRSTSTDLDTEPATKQKATTTTRSELKTEKEYKETQEEEKGIKAAAIVARPAVKGSLKPLMYEYPLEVEGGLYGDTFIELGDETVLKLRTLVVKDIYLM